MKFYLIVIFLCAISLLSLPFLTVAIDFTTDNFVTKDPVISGGGGYSTTTNFKIWHSFSQPAIGLSTSTSNELRAGFLYFSQVESLPPPPPPPPPGGFGGKPTKLAPPPLPTLGPSQPFIPPVIPPFIKFITGEIIPASGCGRSDLNCDGDVDLVDLSILFTKPKVITGRILSLLFSDWTRSLPVPQIENEKISKIVQDTVSDDRLFSAAQLSALLDNDVESSAPEVEKERISVFGLIGLFFKAVWGFLLDVINFILGVFGI